MNSVLLLRYENRQLAAEDIVKILNDSGYFVKIADLENNFKFDTQCADGSSRYSYRFFDEHASNSWEIGAVYVKRKNDTLTADF